MDEIQYFKDLWSTKQEGEPSISATTDENVDPIRVGERTEAIKYSKNKKTPGHDGINILLIKYSPTTLQYRLLYLLNICWRTGYFPEGGGVAIVTPIYRKGNRENCKNVQHTNYEYMPESFQEE
jgi:hypothetical protein